ncbi:MAG: UvrD-helicase domain-containing protein [Spirochaetales bacterium]|jgi:DNA helicase-2/ATP-dependent DNA helicase PcrA|nr:UvrD-helicase domain-containing protein [Spirochaetales bacterium]
MSFKETLSRELNPQQALCASSLEGPLLIIAGAGSGKTRTITYRLAFMLHSGIPQANILALTFTNKAAREMLHRAKALTGKKLTQLTLSTFHAFGLRILKEVLRRAGTLKGSLGAYKENFTIYDEADSISLIKQAARELKLPREGLDPSGLSQLFSSIKTGLKVFTPDTEPWKNLYESYQEHLRIYNAFDFDDLIIKPLQIFREFPEILKEYQKRYGYIMVDEFQDTSQNQYQMVKLLAQERRNLCVVGDDDQSIYSWRGADYRNILQFEKDFPERREIKLEQNYRSTGTILEAANRLIAHNTNRKDKQLWTGLETGKAIELAFPEDEFQEAKLAVETLRTWRITEQENYGDMGLLVRTNSLMEPLEEALLDAAIPYRISGGKSFIKRREIKDIIAYLRLILNPDDDGSLLRIINVPRRGIGLKALEEIRRLGDLKKLRLYSAITALHHGAGEAAGFRLSGRAVESLGEFITLIEKYRGLFKAEKNIADVYRSLLDSLDYWSYLVQENPDRPKAAAWKYQALIRFGDMIERWMKDPDNLSPSLSNYLNMLTLSNQDDEEEDQGKVNLMTIHAAKGLEFNLVFLAGAEDQLIPHAKALEENPLSLEEERRLFYVALTRARKKLFITACQKRTFLREVKESGPSRFLEEIPQELMEIQKAKVEVEETEALDYFAMIRSRLK